MASFNINKLKYNGGSDTYYLNDYRLDGGQADQVLVVTNPGQLDWYDAAPLAASIPYGDVGYGSTSTLLCASVDGITDVHEGTCMILTNLRVNSAKNFSLEINDEFTDRVWTGSVDDSDDDGVFKYGDTALFIYKDFGEDGGWVYIGGNGAIRSWARAKVPTSASINSNGLITFKNTSGSSVFTLQLPIYNGSVT